MEKPDVAHTVGHIPSSALRPMLATLIDAPFDDPDWLFETKWDGYRIVARVEQGMVALYSRRGRHVTADYPSGATALAKMRRRVVLDGELIALDAGGRTSFQLLQNARQSRTRLRYCVFDLLFLDGKDVRRLPLVERKRLLRPILPKGAVIRFSRHVQRYGVKFFRAAERKRLEGIMAKRAQSRYRSGERSRDWLKIKTSKRQEVVIVGFTRPRKSRQHFGALVLAVRDGNAWRYVGHAGTGFSAASLEAIHAKLRRLITQKSPFREPTPNEKQTTWVRPRLVGEVKFTEWTNNGQMRHPAFVGLRTDKPARDVVREKEAHMGKR
jgi:bifunctional non-homologous end joining protein LigD